MLVCIRDTRAFSRAATAARSWDYDTNFGDALAAASDGNTGKAEEKILEKLRGCVGASLGLEVNYVFSPDHTESTERVFGRCGSTCAILDGDWMSRRRDTGRISNIFHLREIYCEPVKLNFCYKLQKKVTVRAPKVCRRRDPNAMKCE